MRPVDSWHSCTRRTGVPVEHVFLVCGMVGQSLAGGLRARRATIDRAVAPRAARACCRSRARNSSMRSARRLPCDAIELRLLGEHRAAASRRRTGTPRPRQSTCPWRASFVAAQCGSVVTTLPVASGCRSFRSSSIASPRIWCAARPAREAPCPCRRRFPMASSNANLSR